MKILGIILLAIIACLTVGVCVAWAVWQYVSSVWRWLDRNVG